jgi:DNA primase
VEEGEEAVRAAVERSEDAVTAELERLTAGATREPQLQAKAAAAATELLRPIPDPILRFSYTRIAADRLRVPVEMLARRFGSSTEEKRPERPASTNAEGTAGGLSGNTAAPPSQVRSTEERVLQDLLKAEEGSQIPPLGELPPPEVFRDMECRNIYEAFCALYAEAGLPPQPGRVQARLGEGGGIVARFAKIMVEAEVSASETPGRKIGFSESLEELASRWRRQRRQEVQREIAEAQRKGDQALLDHLLDERDRLNRSLHRRSRPGVSPGLG